ncbi:hypothetical protein [Azospirillum sp. ST 5-10]|uniref:hypothetical protein n=1 Tax=unclassified Azospirillum TaxID=2630922 RepID=UPI003F4A571D
MTTLPASTKAVGRHTPVEDGPTYLYRVPSYLERAAFRRAMRKAGADYPGDRELYRALRDDLRIIAPVNLDTLLAAVDEAEAATVADMDPDALVRLGDIARLARSLGARYAAVEAERAYWFELVPYFACQHFLIGWEGRPEPFVREHGLTSDATLAVLGEGGIKSLGYKIVSEMTVDEAAAGNSASPSPSPSSRRPSTPRSKSLPQAPADGTSAAPSTTPTPPAS